jgi:hypothetical protein
METSYCVKCKSHTGFIGTPQVVKTKNNRYMLKGQCARCGKTKTRFVKTNQNT